MEGGTITADLAKTGFWLNRLKLLIGEICGFLMLPYSPILSWTGWVPMVLLFKQNIDKSTSTSSNKKTEMVAHNLMVLLAFFRHFRTFFPFHVVC